MHNISHETIDLQQQISYLLTGVTKLKEENAQLKLESNLLKERIKDLESKLKLDSSNSSKPPSSDGLKKKPVIPNLREKTGKAKVSQKGHQGNNLKSMDKVDEVIFHKAECCDHCGLDLSYAKSCGAETRQVIDVEVILKVTDHVAEIKKCKCKKKTKAEFPAHVTSHVQYGTTVQAISSYLYEQCITKDRLTKTMKDVFGLEVSDTTLLKIESKLAANLGPIYQDIGEVWKNARIKYLDETGIRVDGKTSWLHNLSNDWLTHFRLSSRGAVPQDLIGIVMHDHCGPYNKLTGVEHVYCNAHILRELKGVQINDNHVWSKRMAKLLIIAKKIGQDPNATNQGKERCNRLYDVIVESALNFYESLNPLSKKSPKGKNPKRKDHNLVLRLQKFKTETLRFLYDVRYHLLIIKLSAILE